MGGAIQQPNFKLSMYAMEVPPVGATMIASVSATIALSDAMVESKVDIAIYQALYCIFSK